MVKRLLFPLALLLLLGFISPASAQKAKQGKAAGSKSDVKFLDDITIELPASSRASDPKDAFSEPVFVRQKAAPVVTELPSTPSEIERAGKLQFKYAQLLDLEVEMIQNLPLFGLIDEWMGTRYKLGGNTRDGIDCSAFMQVLYSSLYSQSIPRTAREQFDFSRRISRIELKEGDLVFFNTIGGVSHVGMYLQNNKFVHASSSGVTISDLYDDYWLKRFVGVGRIETQGALLSSHP
jgi:hypothetical protein